jgi:hypothetical protein
MGKGPDRLPLSHSTRTLIFRGAIIRLRVDFCESDLGEDPIYANVGAVVPGAESAKAFIHNSNISNVAEVHQ